jgi:hypothetical protein
LAIVAAYLVFFLLVRLWLLYVSRQRGDFNFSIDIPDPGLRQADSCRHVPEAFEGDGGTFGGGGSRGSWSNSSDQPVAVDGVPGVSRGGIDLDFDFGEAGAIAIIVFAAVIAVLFGAGLYLIYEAPAVLSDAAFEMALSAGLLKSLKRMDRANWIGSVFRNTWKPFAVTACFALLFGVLAQHYCPGAHMLKELYDTCL